MEKDTAAEVVSRMVSLSLLERSPAWIDCKDYYIWTDGKEIKVATGVSNARTGTRESAIRAAQQYGNTQDLVFCAHKHCTVSDLLKKWSEK